MGCGGDTLGDGAGSCGGVGTLGDGAGTCVGDCTLGSDGRIDVKSSGRRCFGQGGRIDEKSRGGRGGIGAGAGDCCCVICFGFN